MMSVKEYANDTNHTVAEILKKCEELGIKVKNGDDFLSDDDIIILDNAITDGPGSAESRDHAGNGLPFFRTALRLFPGISVR